MHVGNKRRNNRITKKVCGVFRVIPERIAFEITQFKGVIPAKSTVIAAVDLRMVPLSPTGTALRAAAGIHAVALDACMPFGLQARPYWPPVGSVFAALHHFKCEML